MKSFAKIVIPKQLDAISLLGVHYNRQKKYEIKAIICHRGNSLYSGHYICYGKRNI